MRCGVESYRGRNLHPREASKARLLPLAPLPSAAGPSGARSKRTARGPAALSASRWPSQCASVSTKVASRSRCEGLLAASFEPRSCGGRARVRKGDLRNASRSVHSNKFNESDEKNIMGACGVFSLGTRRGGDLSCPPVQEEARAAGSRTRDRREGLATWMRYWVPSLPACSK